MSLVINQRKDEGDGLAERRENERGIHLLPCKIRLGKLAGDRQTAPVDRYFSPYAKTAAEDAADDENNGAADAALWHASLRGKPLTGVQLDMPKGYTGVMCTGGPTGSTEDGASVTADLVADDGDVTGRIMYWNWDRVPTREDPLLAAFDWVHVSEAMMANGDDRSES